MYNLWFAQQYQRRFYVTAECSHVATAKNIIDTFDGRESEGYYVVDIGITIDNEKGTTGIVTEYRPEIPIHILIIRQWEFLLLPLFNIIENFKITMMANTLMIS